MAVEIVALLTLIVTLIVPDMRENAYENAVQDFVFGNLRLTYYDESLLPDKAILDSRFIYNILGSIVSMICYVIGGWIVRNTARALNAEEISFSAELSKGFKRLGFLVLFLTVFSFVLDLCVPNYFDAYELQELLNIYHERESGSTLLFGAMYTDTTTPLGGILGAMFLFLISILFKHGEALQKQADETL